MVVVTRSMTALFSSVSVRLLSSRSKTMLHCVQSARRLALFHWVVTSLHRIIVDWGVQFYLLCMLCPACCRDAGQQAHLPYYVSGRRNPFDPDVATTDIDYCHQAHLWVYVFSFWHDHHRPPEYIRELGQNRGCSTSWPWLRFGWTKQHRWQDEWPDGELSFILSSSMSSFSWCASQLQELKARLRSMIWEHGRLDSGSCSTASLRKSALLRYSIKIAFHFGSRDQWLESNVVDSPQIALKHTV
jgi:hypothetical protein